MQGVIKYAQRSVLLIIPSGERIEYEGNQPAPEEYENDLLGGCIPLKGFIIKSKYPLLG